MAPTFSMAWYRDLVFHSSVNISVNPDLDPNAGLVAELDARPTGDLEVEGLTPAELATFLRINWSWNIFYGHSLPSADSRSQLSVSGKRMCSIQVNHEEDEACPVKVVR